ncbi:MAG: cell division protein FtsL [Pseudomonadota bacterium]|jgi:cell division protein FtsL
MLRLNILLAIALLGSCVWLVRTSHEARQLFVELERAQTESHNLQIEEERLQLDKRAQATLGRVEDLAKRNLQMRNHGPEITHIIGAQAASEAGRAP